MKNILPLGSIIVLKGDSRKLVICGRKQIHIKLAKTFDYMGFLYPHGYVDEYHTYLFNEEDIETIVFRGYSDIAEIKFSELAL